MQNIYFDMSEFSSVMCDSTSRTSEVFLEIKGQENCPVINTAEETTLCHISTQDTYNDDKSTTESEASSAEEREEIHQNHTLPKLNQAHLFELSSLHFKNKAVLNFENNCFQNSYVEELQGILHKFLTKAQHDNGFVESITIDESDIAKTQIHRLSETCKHLEAKNIQSADIVKQLREQLGQHNAKTKQAMATLRNSYEAKLIELNEKCKIAEREKQASVMNYARREKELLDLRCQKENAEQLAKEAVKDRDKVFAQVKARKPDLSKFKNINEKAANESVVQTKEIERLKEEINSQVIKVRWAQNKLKAEVESHKETKEKCDRFLLEVQHAKEETEHLRKNCQDMIKTYQDSEEIKSNALEIKLQENANLLSKKESEIEKLRVTLKQRSDDLLLLKQKHKDMCNEYQTLKSKAATLDQERVKNLSVLRDYEKIMNSQKATASDMNAKMQEIFDLQNQVEELNAVTRNLEESVEEAISQRNSALNDLVSKERKEQELLMYTEKVTSKNTQMAIEIDEVKSKLSLRNDEHSLKEKLIENLQDELNKIATTREQEKKVDKDVEKTLSTRLKEKEQTTCELLLQLEDLKDEMRTTKRKNAALLKDLSRQLDIARRKNENGDTVAPTFGFSGRARNPDSHSLTSSASLSDRVPPSMASANHCGKSTDADSATTAQGLQHQQLLLERIVRLQQTHATKDEKIDFLNEHVNQLTDCLQKKQHLLQHFLLNEKSDALPPPCGDTDLHLRYGLTAEEMSKKMLSLLEDTLMKNISLKESLKVLGKEVQRLSSPMSSS